ncbi:MAG: hypothetical protein ACTHJ1_10220 [Bordetella sp.]|uniref:hypothetical protein n=1 Tax=Bordetella sp. TaxID=28081 RepID=UPI003F7C3D74
MKTAWISALSKNEPRVAAVSQVLKGYGLDPKGHFWVDDNDKMAWRAALDSLLEAKADVWVVLADNETAATPSVRYALSLMAAALREARGYGFPIVVLWNDASAPELPPAFLPATALQEQQASWAAKIVAKANMPAKGAAPEYRFSVAGDERLGQWFELGPRANSGAAAWHGVVFGVAGEGAEINFQAVGPQGGLPEKTVLEFAQEGMKLQAGGLDFTAWAVRNEVGTGDSYYARVAGSPQAVLFLPYSDDGEAEATVLRLS